MENGDDNNDIWPVTHYIPLIQFLSARARAHSSGGAERASESGKGDL